jgi:hypothetical protein
MFISLLSVTENVKGYNRGVFVLSVSHGEHAAVIMRA